jgi:hypothetical protein
LSLLQHFNFLFSKLAKTHFLGFLPPLIYIPYKKVGMEAKRVKRKLGIPMKEEEYQKFIKAYRTTVYRSISAYARRQLLRKPVEIICRNRSLDDFIELGAKIRKDLTQLINGDHFTPAEKAGLLQKMVLIEDQLSKIVELCCQK